MHLCNNAPWPQRGGTLGHSWTEPWGKQIPPVEKDKAHLGQMVFIAQRHQKPPPSASILGNFVYLAGYSVFKSLTHWNLRQLLGEGSTSDVPGFQNYGKKVSMCDYRRRNTNMRQYTICRMRICGRYSNSQLNVIDNKKFGNRCAIRWWSKLSFGNTLSLRILPRWIACVHPDVGVRCPHPAAQWTWRQSPRHLCRKQGCHSNSNTRPNAFNPWENSNIIHHSHKKVSRMVICWACQMQHNASTILLTTRAILAQLVWSAYRLCHFGLRNSFCIKKH